MGLAANIVALRFNAMSPMITRDEQGNFPPLTAALHHNWLKIC
jgi:hypothetical protein